MTKTLPTTLVYYTLFLGPVNASPFKDTCTPCNPHGETSLMPPAVGSALDGLYVDLVNSVQGIHFKRDQDQSLHQRPNAFCCAETTDCVLVQGYGIPMCYDKFTTNYVFADGSYGNINDGVYNSKSGKIVNLITGNVSDGTNIFANNLSARPNTATLSVPPLYTAAGVGGAIQISGLADISGSLSLISPNIAALATPSATATPSTLSKVSTTGTGGMVAAAAAATATATPTASASASASSSLSQTGGTSSEQKPSSALASSHVGGLTLIFCMIFSLFAVL